MSRDQAHNDEPLASVDQLYAFFEAGCKAADQRGVGTEHEKFGYCATQGTPLPFDGPKGIEALLYALCERFGWQGHLDEGRLLALERDGAAITLEPGGQLELSGRITRNVHETADELATHLDEVSTLAETLGQRWCFFGMHPFDTLDAVPWMPKSRYRIMRDYLPTRGALAAWMMKMTCTVQANFDYRSVDEGIAMMRLGALASPIVTALFANSGYSEGLRNDHASYRMAIWQDTDPDRCGVPEWMVQPDAGIDAYVQWALDVPMFFIRRGGRYIPMHGMPFRNFWDQGWEGERATLGDFELHLSTLFPEARMKRYVEVRSADCGPPETLLALPALFKGLFYDDDATQQALQLLHVQDAAQLRADMAVARREGLDGTLRGRSLRAWASDLLSLARESLERQAEAAGMRSEAIYLDALVDAQGSPRAPIALMHEAWLTHRGERLPLQQAFAIRPR